MGATRTQPENITAEEGRCGAANISRLLRCCAEAFRHGCKHSIMWQVSTAHVGSISSRGNQTRLGFGSTSEVCSRLSHELP